MRHLAVCLATAFFLAVGPIIAAPAAADEGNDIKMVIKDQIAAFLADDLDAAFRHASPSIQRLFGTSSRFGQMVKRGYPMVWRPARFEMGEIIDTAQGPVQLVIIEDQSGQLHEAGYLMTEVDGVWRINGVHVREMPGVGA